MSNILRDNGVDIIKAFAALFVIITHSYLADSRENNVFFPVMIDMAVPVFMILSGYVNAMQIDKMGYSLAYSKKSYIRKLSRIIIPFIPCMIIVLFFWKMIDGETWKHILLNVVYQRWGDGGYYPFIMLQMIFLFPLLYKVSDRHYGIIIIILSNILAEYAFSCGASLGAPFGAISVNIHRIVLTRYLVHLLGGILLYRYRELICWKLTFILASFGLLITICIDFWILPGVIFKLWRTTSALVVFWALAICMLGLQIPKTWSEHVIGLKIGALGRASYHIFLVQMLYYFFVKHHLFDEPNIVVSICTCLIVGYYYHKIDGLIQRKINSF